MNEILTGVLLVIAFISGAFLGQYQERKRLSKLMREGTAPLQGIIKRMK